MEDKSKYNALMEAGEILVKEFNKSAEVYKKAAVIAGKKLLEVSNQYKKSIDNTVKEFLRSSKRR